MHFCTSTGDIILPEDFGVTDFYDVALESGYIIVTQIEATYDSTSKKAGVMNLDFEWVIEPNEDFYKNISDEDGYTVIHNYYGEDFCAGNILYISNTRTQIGDRQRYVDLTTGKIVDPEVVNIDVSSENWKFETYETGITFVDTKGQIMLEANLKNIEGVYNFKNGIAIIQFCNREASKCYFSAINEEGELAFEPIEVENVTNVYGFSCSTDGNIVVVKNASKAWSYDLTGKLLGTFDIQQFTNGNGAWVEALGEGIIQVSLSWDENCLFNSDFTPIIAQTK